MNAVYEWLYDNYAGELQKELRKSEEAAVEKLAQTIPMSDIDKNDLEDCLAHLRIQCGTESFALGVQLGLYLTQNTGLNPLTAS